MNTESAAQRRPQLVRILNLLIVSILVIGAIVAVWDRAGILSYISTISWLSVEEIEVESSWPIDPQEARRWLSSVEGKSLLLLDTLALGKELEKRTWVKSVTLRKNFPDRLWVHLDPRIPVALKVEEGKVWILDERGETVTRWTKQVATEVNLPVLSFSGKAKPEDWSWKSAVAIVSSLDATLASTAPLSEMVLDPYPYFRVFLQSPSLEVLFSAENWETQLPYLLELLRNPPRQTGQIRVISLLSPKKAVVRPDLSH